MGQDKERQADSSLLTFLIADVRGYTRFTVEQGDEGAARLADRFAALCDEVIGQHNGEIIELRGDEALAAFPSARNALRAAVALQQAFTRATDSDPSLPLGVGMGLDAGEPIPLRGGYRGGALNLAARLCSIAGAGEILASDGVVHLARRTEGLVYVDRGDVTLKGLPAPVRVLQIAGEGELPDRLPPLQPVLNIHPTNLPEDPTPFVGRDGEIAAITALLRNPHIRLLTLTGSGGTGKTRLALRIGTTQQYDYRDGVFFCDLSALDHPDHVLPAVAQVFGVKEEGERPLSETLIEQLGNKQLLLILDNVEHLTDARDVVAHLLDGCRELRVLVTSRIPLHLSREHEYPVPPMRTPDVADLPALDDLAQLESVALFTQQARTVRPGFSLTAENAAAVAEICSRLDGLPLAIELAAARIKLFPPQALLHRLSRRLTLLTGGARDRPAKQQTLRGAIDWSYSLLTQEEQLLFARLSVFSGGWTLEAAEDVCDTDGTLTVLEAMASLVDKSLVRQEGEDERRFSMLETIREYALERLDASTEADQIRDCHAAYYLRLAEDAEPSLQGKHADEWMERLEADRDNLRAALARFLQLARAEPELRLAHALEYYWRSRGRYGEGRRWLEAGLDLADDVPAPVRIEALSSAGGLALIQGDHARVVTTMEDVLRLAHEHGDSFHLRGALSLLAVVAYARGDHHAAAQYLEESLSSARADGSGNDLARALLDLGLAKSEVEDFSAAIPLVEEARGIFQSVGNAVWEMIATGSLAYISLLTGERQRAHPRLVTYLAMAQQMSDPLNITAALEGLAMLAGEEGESSRAARLFAATQLVREKTGARLLSPRNHAMIQKAMISTREQLGEAEWQVAWQEGRAMTLDETAALAVQTVANPHIAGAP